MRIRLTDGRVGEVGDQTAMHMIAAGHATAEPAHAPDADLRPDVSDHLATLEGLEVFDDDAPQDHEAADDDNLDPSQP